MFDYDPGLGPGKWLKWFMAAIAIYGVSTFWPDNQTAIFVGGVFAALAIGIARHQIRKARCQK
jgi:small-conductance mechanosensitive channel